MSPSTIEYLHHILDELIYLLGQTQGLQKDKFMDNPTLKRAFVRSLEIVGEATKQLPAEFKQKYRDVEWKEIAGMRDKLIHHYFGVDYDVVWDAVMDDVPQLRQMIEQMIADEDNS
ncbi:MAG: DUF86 domain-containing protein [Caldilineaceae bacterium]